jgi:NAD(P)-dependent dehydrogenase (short-subunit alcohol dehydrogenase family)
VRRSRPACRHVLADTQTVADEIRTRYGKLDAVFLNAGVGPMQPVEAVDEASFDNMFAVTVKGQFFTLQKVLPLLQDGASRTAAPPPARAGGSTSKRPGEAARIDRSIHSRLWSGSGFG